ncbi:MAG: aspartate aminotransferase family protein [Brevinematia bacterium]
MKEEVKLLEKEWLIPFYDRLPLNIVKGKGHFVYDDEDKKYLDFTSGISVVNFGHANKKINSAIKKQLDRISHISNYYYNELQIELAKKISEKSFKAKLFFCNSGTEANEAAIKVSRLIGNATKNGKNKIISLNNSFHGRTLGAISLTGQEKYRKGFEPIVGNIDFVEPGNIEELESKFDENTCAIFIEAIQGEGGVKKQDERFVLKARELATKYNAMLIFDEVQTGIGRAGKYFGYQLFDVVPDAITLAKSLANGIPIGAFAIRSELADKMKPGLHASTFGGNYIACTAGIKVMELLDENLVERINHLSLLFKSGLEKVREKYPDRIKDLRIYGLMIGIDIDEKIEVKDIIKKLVEKGILTLRAGVNTLRLLPPFTIGENEIEFFCDTLLKVLA